MKKNRISVFLLILVVISAFSFGRISEMSPPGKEKATCPGYTIIAFGKGINCYGDTVALTKKQGLQVLALGH